MKLRKIKSALLIVGFGAILLGLVLFMVTPLLIGSGFEYAGLEAFLAGCKAFVSFDFNNTIYTLLFAFFAVTIIIGVVWGIVMGVNKCGKHFIALIFDVLSVLVLELILFSYFVAPIRFNGVEGQLFGSIMSLEGQLLGKVLSMLVLGFLYVALMFLTLFGFIDIATTVLGDNVKNGFAEAIKEKIIQALPDPMEGYDDRKAREEAFFKACIETGEFTQYDELDFGRPLEGYTEEPVFETTEVEEETKVIEKRVTVKVTQNQSIEVK